MGARLRLVLLLCLVAGAFGSVSLGARGAWAQAGGERIDAYDVSIDIQRDGSISVTEQIAYDFGSTKHHGIFRTIPVRFHYDDRNDRAYRLHVLSVAGSPGTPTSTRSARVEATFR
ncbi:MAG TPA: DUF2207 domain-containing protein [Actinomycetota bacterium]|nr:DUF2207 domain-containing protein [Actinomycetota bacterium]